MANHKNDAALSLTEEQSKSLPQVIQQIMSPIAEGLTKALEQMAIAQANQNDRLDALEKQIRLGTPVTRQQVKYINEAIKSKSRELLYKRGIEDVKMIRKLGNMIRKSVLSRYGVSALSEIPKNEYSVILTQVNSWMDALKVRDVVNEFRKAASEATSLEME